MYDFNKIRIVLLKILTIDLETLIFAILMQQCYVELLILLIYSHYEINENL